MDDVTAAENDRMLEQLIEGELSREVEQLLLCLKPLDRKIFMKLFVGGRICRADKRRYRTSERCHLQPGIQRKAENEKHVFETEGGMKR